VLLEALAAERRAGADFAAVWSDAVARAIAVAPHGERTDWLAALTSTRAGWQAAWDGQPLTDAQAALMAVAADDERDQPVEPRRHRVAA
jgi:hypothetical protein